MIGKSMASAALAVAFFVSFAPPVAAGPIAVYTQISARSGSDEIRVSDLGSFAVLTTGGGVNNVVTVAANQTTASQPVVGFWPVIGFRDRPHYDAERGRVAVVSPTPVSLYLEVWNGEYGLAREVQQVYVDAIVTARVSAEVGQNSMDWMFPNPTKQVQFGETLVSITYEPVQMPDGTPQIYFEDGSPRIGFPGPVYYPTLLTATVEVTRGLDPDPLPDPGSNGPTNPPGGDPSATPEPASAVLLAGFALGGLVFRRIKRVTRAI